MGFLAVYGHLDRSNCGEVSYVIFQVLVGGSAWMEKHDQMPAIFINTIPKSGTNLLNQIVLGLPNAQMNEYIFYEGLPKQFAKHASILNQAVANNFYLGHIYHSPQWADYLRKAKIKTIFMSRDLRDVLVSLTYFILDQLPHYPIYPDLLGLKSQKERYLLLINGVRDYPDIKAWFQLFGGWMKEPHVLAVTYEDFMATPALRTQKIEQIAVYIWEGLTPPLPISELVARMKANINQAKSFTFRKGTIGGWREEFDEEVKTAFKRVAGDVLLATGYEKDNNW
jgi:sulfotransferase 6B1